MTPTPVPEEQPAAPPETPVDASASPVIWVETTQYDTGILPNDTQSVKYIEVANHGNAPLVIKSAKASCGCVAVKMADNTIAPKASSNLAITINPKKIPGFESKKTVSIKSNDPQNPDLTIAVTARIDPEFAVEPENIDLGEVQKGSSAEGSLVLRQLGTEPIEVVAVKPWGVVEGVTLSFEKIAQEQWRQPDRPEYRIMAALSPEVSPGPFMGRFRIQTTCQRMPQYSNLVKATVKAFYSFQPLSVVLHNNPSIKAQASSASVTVTADRPFEITDISPSNPAIVATARPGDAANTEILDISLGSEGAPGSYNERVSFSVKAGNEVYRDRVYARVLVRKAQPAESETPLPRSLGKPLRSRLPRMRLDANVPPGDTGRPAARTQESAPSAEAGQPAAAPVAETVSPAGEKAP